MINIEKLLLTGIGSTLLTLSTQASDFSKEITPFLEKYCTDCHDDDTQKGDIALHDLTKVTIENADLWKSIWEEVALKEMPPRKKKKQPDLNTRLKVSELITAELSKVMKKQGGFTEHKRPIKGNHLDHDLLFNTKHNNLEPTSTPARIWRIHPQEHMVRINELISNESEFDPTRPGVRTRGDHIAANMQGEIKVYFGLDRYIGHFGGTAAYAASVTGFPAMLSVVRDHGLRNYPFLYTVNSSEATQIMSVAESVIRFMAYGPEGEDFQFGDNKQEVMAEIKKLKLGDIRGLPTGIFYSNEVKRPLTPVYDLFSKPGIDDKRLTKAVDFIFEMLTLRPPTKEETENYLTLLKKSVKDLGKEDGIILGLAPIFLDRDALFRPELANYSKPDKYGRVMLQGQELALAINGAFSYIRPDKKLRDSLAKGQLKTRKDVKREVTRILNDDSIRKPRILQFFKEYFDYELSAGICKDEKALAKAGGERATKHYTAMNSMIANTDRLIELIVHEDKNVLKELLTTNRVIYDSKNDASYFANIDQLLKPEKFKGKKGDRKKNKKEQQKRASAALKATLEQIFSKEKKNIYVRKPQFMYQPDKPKTLATFKDEQRVGILTHPSWLVSHSDVMDNHAILRGRWIRERLLGDAVPDVPITVDAMLPDEPDKTLRHRMRVTRENECWRCHQKMDPLGLPFEMFNHAGLLRDKEHGKPVDTSGAILLSGDPELDGPVTDAIDMIKKLSKSEKVEQVFVRHVFRYWMGRNENINDAPVLKAAHKAYKDNDGSMKALLISLLTSDAFLYRKVERPKRLTQN
ncbi:MAG: DUF1588 domain-containing protein [Lentisphaeraceae bacterium]|nr:DUF1588 domain-containing protein [Lentisphaeraceae bacterium]